MTPSCTVWIVLFGIGRKGRHGIGMERVFVEAEEKTHVETQCSGVRAGKCGRKEGPGTLLQELNPKQIGLISYQAATVMTCVLQKLTARPKRKHWPLHPSFHADRGRRAEWLGAQPLKTLVVGSLPADISPASYMKQQNRECRMGCC